MAVVPPATITFCPPPARPSALRFRHPWSCAPEDAARDVGGNSGLNTLLKRVIPSMSLLIVAPDPVLIRGILGALGIMVVTYVLVARQLRSRVGVQPGYRRLLFILIVTACTSALFHFAKRAGIDVLHGRPRDIFSLVLGSFWAGMSAHVAYQWHSSGKILMDFGPAPLAKMHIGLAVFMAGLAIMLVTSGESSAQAFMYGMWAIWSLVSSRGRLQIREQGISTMGLLRWRRIARCVAGEGDRVHLHLNRGWKRDININVPSGVRDEFVKIVEQRAGATAQ